MSLAPCHHVVQRMRLVGTARGARLCPLCGPWMTRRANHFGLSEIVSSPPHKNISLNTSGKSPLVIRPSHPNEGRCAGHERAVGCDGRDSVGRAVAAAGRDEPRERHAARRPTALPTILAGTGRDARGPARALAGWARTAKWCGPDAPRLASSRVEMHPAQPGRDASSIRMATVAKCKAHRGDHV